MVTTKKWGAPATSDGPAPLAAGRAATRAVRPVALIWPLVLWLLAGCAPPAAEALREGVRLLGEGKARAAIEPLRQATILLSTNAVACAQAWNHLGLAYHYTGQLPQAEQAYRYALAKNFNLFAARYNLGCVLLEQNRLAGAINELTTYTTHRSDQVDGWLRLGSAQLRARLLDAADASYLQALRLNGRLPEAFNGLGVSQALRRRPREAFQNFHEALKRDAHYSAALLNEAIVAQHYLRDKPLALQRYQAYLETPESAVNRAAVTAVVRALEVELRPPASATTTNQAPVVGAASQPGARTGHDLTPTNVATSSLPLPSSVPPGRLNAPPTNPPPIAATATNPARPATAPETVATPPEPPLEVVKLPAEPDLKPAPDRPLQPQPPAVATPEPASAKPAAERPTNSALLPTLAKPPPPKKSFVQKLNPLKWFSKRKPAPGEIEPAPIPPVSQPKAANPPVEKLVASTSATSPTAAPAKPAPKPRTFPRYVYQSPSAPAPGNRPQADAFLAEGLQAHRSNRLPEAIAAYRQAAQADPSFFDAHYNLGVAAYVAGDWRQALAADEVALAIKPADEHARVNFALALQQGGYPLDAAQELESVLRAHADDVQAHLALANLYAQTLDDLRQARDHYARVLQLQPNHPQAPLIRYWLARNPL